MKIHNIAYVSGTRADYGLMSYILKTLDKNFSLQVYSTGMHLMKTYGMTHELINKDFPSVKKVPAIFENDSREAMGKFIGQLIVKLTDEFKSNRPDFVITLGDRPEMLATATVCAYLSIPSAQVHGGDRTYTVDEMARHAITKMSHLHFAATKKSAERIEKMGEEKWRIHIVGAPSLDTIYHESLPTKNDVYDFLKLKPPEKYILVTQHPVSEEREQSAFQMNQTLEAVRTFKLPVVIIYPNTDAGSRKMIKTIEKEVKNPLFKLFANIEYKMFLAVARYCVAWVGNSSAGMIESGSLRVPVVNAGIRQIGREHGLNVINVPNERKDIKKAVSKSLTDYKFLSKIQKMTNPWGDGHSADRILKILKNLSIDSKLLGKQITY